MNQLPEGWVVAKLGEIAKSEKGKKPKNQSAEQSDEYCYPYVDIEAFEKGVIKSYTDGKKCVICNEDDFLMVWDGSRSGLVGKGMSGALGSTLVRILMPDNIDNLYAYYFLLSKYGEINTRAKGSGTPHVDPDLLWNYELPIPPIETQTAIVSKIESLFAEIDAGIACLKKARQQLAHYRQALLKNAFSGKLTEQWRASHAHQESTELLAQIQTARAQHYQSQLADWQTAVEQWEAAGKTGKKPGKPKAPSAVVKYEAGEDLPSGWVHVALSEIAEVSGGLTKNVKRNNFEEKVPYLRVANVYANELRLEQIEKIGILESEKERTLLKKGDLLIVEGNGSIDQIGRVAIWNDEIKPCYHQNHLIKTRSLSSCVDAKFILFFLMSPAGRKGIVDVASSTTGLHTLSLSKVANLIIPVCPLEEQTEIVRLLDSQLAAADQFAAELAAQLKHAEHLKQSVLKAAFTGRLS